MQPNWEDAPEWANYLAMDSDGCWHWYECEPYKEEHQWYSKKRSLFISCSDSWRDTLQTRP